MAGRPLRRARQERQARSNPGFFPDLGHPKDAKIIGIQKPGVVCPQCKGEYWECGTCGGTGYIVQPEYLFEIPAKSTTQKSPTSPIPANAPPEVRQVAKKLIENGAEAGLPADLAAYVYLNASEEWVVGPNFEGSGGGMTYKGGQWSYISEDDGRRKPMRGGLQEALSNASIWYTG